VCDICEMKYCFSDELNCKLSYTFLSVLQMLGQEPTLFMNRTITTWECYCWDVEIWSVTYCPGPGCISQHHQSKTTAVMASTEKRQVLTTYKLICISLKRKFRLRELNVEHRKMRSLCYICRTFVWFWYIENSIMIWITN